MTLPLFASAVRTLPPWRSFSVLSWNVLADAHVRPSWYPRVLPQDLAPTVRRRRVLDRLLALEADVMALQEVDLPLLRELRGLFPGHELHHAPHNGEGVAALVRGGAERAEELEVGRKRALVLDLPGSVRLAVVHLTWSGSPEAGKPRPGLAQLEAVLARRPAIVAGDLNAMPGWPERQALEAAGFACLGPAGPTCNVNAWLQPLDAVYAAAGWRGRSLTLPEIDEWTPMPSERHPSDHLPVRVEIDAC